MSGVKHASTAASGMVSLEIALRTLDIGPGDEVITIPFTWINTTEVIGQVGARPVFIGIKNREYRLRCTTRNACTSNRSLILAAILLGIFLSLKEQRGRS